MKLKNRYSIMAFCFLAISYMGCKKFVQIPPAPNLIVSTQIFADSADANSAVLDLYTSIMQNGNVFATYNGNITVYTGLSSDELSSNTGNSQEKAAYTNSLISTSDAGGIFTTSYPLIYRANAIIEGLSGNNSGMSASARNQMIGEAKVIRAFCYFHLVNLFGAVPLVTTTDYHINATLPRSSITTVYQQIIDDLLAAESLLPVNYITPGRVRINKYSATALLARVYLYQKQWSKAEASSTQIINSGLYSLVPNLNNVFLAGSNEAILQLLPVQSGFETTEGTIFVPTSKTVIPKYTINTFLLNAFEAGDQRKADWINNNIVKGVVYNYPYKYKLGHDQNSDPLENYMLFRLAEQYLIRAEAEAQGAGSGLSGAVTDLNTIRHRAGLADYAGVIDAPSVLNAIYHEREVELFCEWGHRWYDLKRTDNANTTMGAPGGVCAAKGGTWKSDWQLYPIPFSQIQANPFLTQNPGY